ncbi:MAG: flavin reductase family protein [Nitrospinaceae bacterium]|jgi:flavin reductase (DIM6/NTAB) family NADH-FMN oxidoreductase RutF|nr:flavin reductase family protein [Nitrospinaceae bacterium]
MKNKKEVGKALGRIPSGLFIVTAKYEDQEDAVLASWVNQSSFEPPEVTIALAQMRSARLLIEASQSFIVNVLGKETNELMKHFFKSHEGSVFDGLKTRKGIEGIRILSDAVAYLECRLADAVVSGDHVVYFGEVVGGKMLKGGEPSIHVRDNGFNY